MKGLETSEYSDKQFALLKYADDIVLLAKEETALRGVFHRLIEDGRYYGMEMKVEKN